MKLFLLKLLGRPMTWRPLLRRAVAGYWPFRVAITVSTLLFAEQPVFAGQFLAGEFDSLHTHRVNATIAGIAMLVTAAMAALIRWSARGPLWPALACLTLFGLTAGQIALGFARVLTVHVPLGVTIIVLAVMLTVWAWRHPDDVGADRG